MVRRALWEPRREGPFSRTGGVVRRSRSPYANVRCVTREKGPVKAGYPCEREPGTANHTLPRPTETFQP